ncbi:unnamed protein product [Musa textilis]
MLAQSKNKVILEGPVCNGRRVIGWHTNRKGNNRRRFHVDISGFAFNSRILWNPRRFEDLQLWLDTMLFLSYLIAYFYLLLTKSIFWQYKTVSSITYAGYRIY